MKMVVEEKEEDKKEKEEEKEEKEKCWRKDGRIDKEVPRFR